MTYTHLTSWLTDARNLTNPSTTILLIGNKKDLEAQRDVTYEEAAQFAKENGASRSCAHSAARRALTRALVSQALSSSRRAQKRTPLACVASSFSS